MRKDMPRICDELVATVVCHENNSCLEKKKIPIGTGYTIGHKNVTFQWLFGKVVWDIHFQHFGNLNHNIPSSILSMLIFFLLAYFILQVSISYLSIVKVTNNHFCAYLAQLWNLGQPCCCTRCKYWKMARNIYIIQFCLLYPFQTTQHMIKSFELPTF